jgi:hypothetical protein
MTAANEPDDDLAAALAPSAAPARPGLRDALRGRTEGVVRRRYWLRLGRWAVALAGCYLAGLATVWLPRPDAPADRGLGRADVAGAPSVPPDPRAGLPEEARRWLAEGDRYVVETGDLESALRCYRQALDAGGGDALAVAPTDNWLLISLKTARWKEQFDANRDR